MRRALVVIAVLAVGCPSPRVTRHVFVPRSSAPCWRECQAIGNTCRGGRIRCEDKRLACLLTCDGAYETPPEVEQRW